MNECKPLFHGMHPELLVAFMLYQAQLQEFVGNLLNAFTSMVCLPCSGPYVVVVFDYMPLRDAQ